MDNTALKELLFKLADDALIIGHRHSEWIGIGPVIEEDIAFGSIAQDKVGQANNLYLLLENLGEVNPDRLAFFREEKDYKCCHFAELPTDAYDDNLVRHFLYTHSEALRYEMLVHSSYTPLADLAKKVSTEIKYHVFHADTWMKSLANGNEESKLRIQTSLNKLYPIAMGIFEAGDFEAALIADNIFEGEEALKAKYITKIGEIISSLNLSLPTAFDEKAGYGGRHGFHTDSFAALLKEMGEVIHTDPSAEW
ncbi:MAG: phenylacetate-CoA oxygenase subunit PaaC [Bacteroidetes bacterium]|nr:phenylacetate-CoA oxygenase subunit PaaC [Bacteroidota bacterium]